MNKSLNRQVRKDNKSESESQNVKESLNVWLGKAEKNNKTERYLNNKLKENVSEFQNMNKSLEEE